MTLRKYLNIKLIKGNIKISNLLVRFLVIFILKKNKKL
jgi:hypothetical protein